MEAVAAAVGPNISYQGIAHGAERPELVARMVDRPRDGVRRVEPLEKTDPPAETSQGQEQRTEEIARMVESALSNSRLKILQYGIHLSTSRLRISSPHG